MFYKITLYSKKEMTSAEVVETRNSLYPDSLYKENPKKSNHGLLKKLMYSLGHKKLLSFSEEKMKESNLVNILDDVEAFEQFATQDGEIVSFYLVDQSYNSHNSRYALSSERFANQAVLYFNKMIPDCAAQVQKVDEIPQLTRISWLKKLVAELIREEKTELSIGLTQFLSDSENEELEAFVTGLSEVNEITYSVEYSEALFAIDEKRPFLLQFKVNKVTPSV